MTLLAIWIAFYVRGVQQQKASVEAIRECGGTVRYDFQYPAGRYAPKDFDPNAESSVPRWILECVGIDFFHSVLQVDLVGRDTGLVFRFNPNRSDGALKHLIGLRNLRSLNLYSTQASDNSMRYLCRVRKLEYLTMDDANIGDEGVAHLAGLKRLRSVHIFDVGLTDASMELFAGLPALEVLWLGGTTVTDDGLTHLADLEHLEVLGLEGAQITDAGLIHLEKLPSLKELWVVNTQVTWGGADQFKNPRVRFEGGGLR
jgi:hypothetical protein